MKRERDSGANNASEEERIRRGIQPKETWFTGTLNQLEDEHTQYSPWGSCWKEKGNTKGNVKKKSEGLGSDCLKDRREIGNRVCMEQT